jgi:hypothetical protein
VTKRAEKGAGRLAQHSWCQGPMSESRDVGRRGSDDPAVVRLSSLSYHSLYVLGVYIRDLTYSAPITQKGVGRPSAQGFYDVVGYTGR